MGHMNHDLPMGLNKASGGLPTRSGSNNVGIVVKQVFANFCTKQFGIAIGPEASGIQARVPPKEAKQQ